LTQCRRQSLSRLQPNRQPGVSLYDTALVPTPEDCIMPKTLMRLGTVLIAASFAGAALAQAHRPGGAPAAVPHVSAPAPHFSAPAPHINAAPHITAAPHFNAAPHVSAAPRISAPRASAQTFTPHGRTVTPHFAARPNLAGRNVAHQTFRGAASRHGFQGSVAGRSVARSTAHNAMGRNLSRGTGAVARSTGRATTRAHALARTNGRPGTVNGPGIANRQVTANGRNRLSGAQLANLSRPLGARNRNFEDRHRFFAERRRFHHGGFVGWFGPVFWPYAYDDVFDYAFWPAEYDNYGFWANAYDDVLTSAFWSPGTEEIYASVGAPQGWRGRSGSGRSHSQSQRPDQAYRAAVATCRAGEPGLTQWPIDEIAQIVQPTQEQQQLLEALKAASEQAIKVLQAACPSDPPSTPIGRLDAIANRLEAMLQAVDIVRPALAKFYASLSDEQKARFNAMGRAQGSVADRTGTAAKSEAGVCGDQAPGGLTAQALDRIKQEVRPRGDQIAALDELRGAAAKAAAELRAACPTETPITPTARLDAMAQHLQAMLDAVKTVRPTLAKFYASLNDEQKARFNILRPQQG
jgi:hypothetical protein